MERFHSVAVVRIEVLPWPPRAFRNRPAATVDGKHVGHAVAGEIAEAEFAHRLRRAFTGCQSGWAREVIKPLAIRPAQERMRGPARDARPVISHIGIELAEGDVGKRSRRSCRWDASVPCHRSKSPKLPRSSASTSQRLSSSK